MSDDDGLGGSSGSTPATPVAWPPSGTGEVEVEGRRVRITTLERVLWPHTGSTKRRMLDYYAAVAPVLVPHLRDRPLTLRRFPEGVEGPGWYQVQCRGRPDWMAVARVQGEGRSAFDYCLVNDLPSLLWVANLGTIELHPFLAPASAMDRPSVLVFDLDPGPPAGLLDCCREALRLRELLRSVGLESSVKTSGSVGLHVYAPLDGTPTFEDTKAFARAVAALLERRHPEAVVERMRRSLRPGKVLIDWLQNDPTRSTIAPYSLRALPWPTVSTPLAWEEVEEAWRQRRAAGLVFEPEQVLERVSRSGDLFAPVLERLQPLLADRLPAT